MHEYMRRLLKANENGVVEKEKIVEVHVFHDNDCGIYTGKHCNCDPEIKIDTTEGPISIQHDGTLKEIH